MALNFLDIFCGVILDVYLKASNEVTGHKLSSDSSGLTENLF